MQLTTNLKKKYFLMCIYYRNSIKLFATSLDTLYKIFESLTFKLYVHLLIN